MEQENITLEEAISNVDILNDLIIKSDAPLIEGASLPIHCFTNFDTNFEDKNAYITGYSKFIEEATRHSELNKLLSDGFKYAGILYTWRCCTRSIPMAKSNDQENRNDINKKIIDVLGPEVEKLYNFLNFTKKSISHFSEEVKRLCISGHIKDFTSEDYLILLGRLLDMFVVLDELKNMKASIKNDFSTFKRSIQFLQLMSTSDNLQQMQELSMFLAMQNKIKEDLKLELQGISGYEELLCDIINVCVHHFENQMYVTPDEKYMLVKVIAFSLYLIDSPNVVIYKLDSKKRISITSIDKIFKTLTVVPLFGDMQMEPFSFVKKCHNYDSSKWSLSNKENSKCQVDIVDKAKIIHQRHDEYVANIMKIKIDISLGSENIVNNDEKSQEITNLVISGLQLLCSWTCDVLETVSWKLLNPTNEGKNKECPGDAEEYERATRYNYNHDEKSALVVIIGMIKGLQRLLVDEVRHFTLLINRNLYGELQDFVQITVKDLLMKSIKGKKDMLKGILMGIVETCIDNSQYDQVNDQLSVVSKTKSKKRSTSSDGVDCNENLPSIRKSVPPSLTQLYMVRGMLENLTSERCGYGKRGLKKDIDNKYIEKINTFLEKSFYWSYLINIDRYLFESCDLSQLWFREFYLEMTMGRRIQFPIEMSFPWILTNHILSHFDQSHLMQYILYQLDLYNDAAHFALTKFKTQFLYDELEAEFNLCFDQFIFKLSEGVFTHYKQLASSYLLDKQFKSKCESLGIFLRSPEALRFELLLKQRHVQLLGRSIDLNKLISQRINIAVLNSLDVAISKFESESLVGIVKLEYLLNVNRLCYDLLKKHLFSLSDFDDLFIEANGLVSSDAGRISLHIFFELNYDVFPNYCYNTSTRRFVRGNIRFNKVPERMKPTPCDYRYEFGSKTLGAAAENIAKMHSGYIGFHHLRIIARLLGYREVSILLREFTDIIELLLSGKLKDGINECIKRMPKVCKLPLSTYGSSAVMEYYLHHTKDIRNYENLNSKFGQQFRIFGNIFIFIQLLEDALHQEEIFDLHHGSTFLFNVPTTGGIDKNEREKRYRQLEIEYESLHFSKIVNLYGTKEQVEAANEAELYTKEKLSLGFSIFEYFLQYIRDILINDTLFTGNFPLNSVMSVDECSEFHRLWSAIQFVFCVPSNEEDNNDNSDKKSDNKKRKVYCEEMFGDGIIWTGCIFIKVLDQEKRFNVLDFCYHLDKIHKGESKCVSRGDDYLNKMISRIHGIELLNNQIFTFLRKFMDSDENEYKFIREYNPPQHEKYSLSQESC